MMLVSILAFVVIFSIVVFVHELGHFAVAKLAGVRVDEFGFGYPPRLLRIAKRGDTEYTLNTIPVGGFVRVAGDDDPSDPRSMARRSPWLRAAFLLAGPGMNVVLAALLFAATFMMGVPVALNEPGVVIGKVMPGSPAEKAGLQVGDTVLSIDGQPVDRETDLPELVSARLDREVALVVQRHGVVQPEPIRLVPRSEHARDQGPIGVAIYKPTQTVRYPFGEALWKGFLKAGWTIVSLIGALVLMVRGLIRPELTGPVGIAQMTGEVVKLGFIQLVGWTAFLSANLFIINLLPIPALDGGRLIFVGLEILRGGRRIDPRKEGLVHLVGLGLLLCLFAVVSYFDLLRVVQNTGFPGP